MSILKHNRRFTDRMTFAFLIIAQLELQSVEKVRLSRYVRTRKKRVTFTYRSNYSSIILLLNCFCFLTLTRRRPAHPVSVPILPKESFRSLGHETIDTILPGIIQQYIVPIPPKLFVLEKIDTLVADAWHPPPYY